MATTTAGYERDQAIADELWTAQQALTRAIQTVQGLGDERNAVIQAAADCADDICIQGDDVARQLRALAMRFDRCVATRW